MTSTPAEAGAALRLGVARRGRLPLALPLGWLVGLLLLAVPMGDPYPVRSLAVEWSVYTICYGLIVVPLALVLRKRHPAEASTLVRVLVIALLVRVAFSVWVTSYAYGHNPLVDRNQVLLAEPGLPDRSRSPFDGYIGPDPFTFSAQARTIASYRTGQTYGFDIARIELRWLAGLDDETAANAAAAGSEVASRFGWRFWISHVAIAAGLISLLGFSVLATILPFCFFGAVLCLLVYRYLMRLTSSQVAAAVLVWLVFAPEFVCGSALWHEDVPTSLCLVLLLRALLPFRHRFEPRALWGLLLPLVLLQAFRPQLTPILIVLAIYGGLTASGTVKLWPRLYMTLGLLGGFVAGALAPNTAIGSTNYFVGYVINLVAIPGPVYFTNGGLLEKVYAMADLWSALAWPLLGGWFLIGVWQLVRSRSLAWAPALTTIAAILGAATARYPGEYGAGRLKLLVFPLMLGVCFEAIARVRRSSPRTKRRALAFCALYTSCVWAMHVAMMTMMSR